MVVVDDWHKVLTDHMNRIVEIRSYALKVGTAAEFHNVVTSTAIPMLRARGFDVVAFGPSPHDPNAYFLIRAFDDLADLQAQEETFYTSEAWRQGPREAIISRIESYLDTILSLSDESIDDMRKSNSSQR